MALDDPSFELTEDYAFRGRSSIRLKNGQLRFRGVSTADNPIGRIPVVREQIDQFVAVLDFLDVWVWRSDYNPEECGYTVCDGMAWGFSALINGNKCLAGGTNAFPAFSDSKKASLSVERYGLLIAATRYIFRLNAHDGLFR